ncbi:dihydrodipicolinate synthase family protein [Lederbergia citrea]|uniref:Dihydrodipicolinate synthase family protein n=1 Tax=Lederbergia citrea TaxID=2833581 RepID=A0A942UNK1_9BACI|nr:dihydrodipicolinate synthase family protein [Lederbergia citrea]MBS4176155.1 dihydrodipicolinate synthase family protein [Lederbergia citrea]MBS4202715.1 dihydrodipicolinate synthase family protein [Lederbergia citrea]MBS4222617.1 dihydrodipicolinate synthase family protein [Lederbergia citrea]
MTYSLKLPSADGSLFTYEPSKAAPFKIPNKPFECRIAFSAVHVVCDPLANADPLNHPQIDWENTLSYRRHLWSMGLSVAEAMDTAQRGMGLNWESAKELIRRSVAEAKSVGGRIACGAGTDHLLPGQDVNLNDVIAAYEEQCEFVEGEGGQIILMASRALAACATGPEDYERVYGRILQSVSKPVILHWLGDMFDPALTGYWGHDDLDLAMEVCLRVIQDNADKVDGIKISLLDADKEVKMRRMLPEGVRMYTGDDFNYASLIQGDEFGFSHALLGIFDAIAPAASTALHELDQGNLAQYHEILEKTVPLSRHIFQKPTYAYKTGIIFMAYLNGHQSHFRMIGGAEGSRSMIHLAELFVLADKAGLLVDPELAVKRMKLVTELSGIR